MSSRTGTADSPLHGGHVPRWLSERMAKLGRVICEAIILHYGRDELLRRLAHPFWFQSFGAVMGMDWHSSGITTSVLAALKRGLPADLGVFVCGGRGKQSRRTPDELTALSMRLGLDGERLVRASRLVAKVDSAAVQDGFALYLHGFIVTADGRWTVVQQGMNTETRTARRYHWLSEGLRSFTEAPHAAIAGPPQGAIVNLVDARALPSQQAQLALVAQPDLVSRTLSHDLPPPHLVLPDHHEVRRDDVHMRRVRGALAAAAERGPKDFADLLLTPGLGARTLFTLAQVAEVIHGAPCRFDDPARFSFALGGKDGHPFPVPLDVYDRTLSVMRQAIGAAKLGNDERLSALQRLDAASRRLEKETALPSPSFESFIAREREQSHAYGGMTVDGPAQPMRRAESAAERSRAHAPRQLSLF